MIAAERKGRETTEHTEYTERAFVREKEMLSAELFWPFEVKFSGPYKKIRNHAIHWIHIIFLFLFP